MRSKSIIAITSAGICLAGAGVAHAGIISHDGSVDLRTTDWTEMVNIPRFDDMGGTRVLKSVTVFLMGTVEGSAQAESMDEQPATVELDLSAEISLSLNGTELAVVLPLVHESFNADAFDGAIDFLGTSGASFLDVMSTDDVTMVHTDPPMDLSAFIGGGTVGLTAHAVGLSSGSGAGNLVLQFSASASMAYRVTYDFNVVPAPPAAALGLVAAPVALRRRRR